jgi:ribosomal-protein-alanine N-acetyltransferase
MSIAIRRARAADAPLLARLHRACFEDSWDEAAFRSFLESGTALTLIAGPNVNANDSQAFIVLQIAGDESEILTLGTLPAARRSGLARVVLKTAAGEAFRRSARALFLEVAEDNAAATALYRAAGFSATGRRKGYYARPGGKSADALTLRAPLPLGI